MPDLLHRKRNVVCIGSVNLRYPATCMPVLPVASGDISHFALTLITSLALRFSVGFKEPITPRRIYLKGWPRPLGEGGCQNTYKPCKADSSGHSSFEDLWGRNSMMVSDGWSRLGVGH